MAPIAAAGAWNMGRWDEMQEYVYAIDSGAAPTSSANAFLRAVLDVHREDYRHARSAHIIATDRVVHEETFGTLIQYTFTPTVGHLTLVASKWVAYHCPAPSAQHMKPSMNVPKGFMRKPLCRSSPSYSCCH